MRGSFVFDVDAASAFIAGVSCAALFNPFDRAMYLSSCQNRSFFMVANFARPFQGVAQASIQRAFIYLFLQAKLERQMKPVLYDQLSMNESMSRFCVGVIAGGVNGLVLNPIVAVKHYTWRDVNYSFSFSVRDMWLKAGCKGFLNGIHTSMMRGMVFGGAYEISREIVRAKLPVSTDHISKSQMNFIANLIAAGMGTMISSPLIFIRSIQHYTPLDQMPPTIRSYLKQTWLEAQCYPFGKKLSFFMKKFKTREGMLGASTRMALAQQVCDGARVVLNNSGFGA